MQPGDPDLDSSSTPQEPRPFSTSFAQSVDPTNPPFQHFDEEALFTSLHERVDYLRAFLDFTHEDVEALNDIVSWLQAHPWTFLDPVHTFLSLSRYHYLNRSLVASSTKSMRICSLLTLRNQLSCRNQKIQWLVTHTLSLTSVT